MSFPTQLRETISALRPPPGGTCPKHLHWETFRRHPDQMLEPPQLAPLNAKEQQLHP